MRERQRASAANRFGLCAVSGHKAKWLAPHPSAGDSPSLIASATNARGRARTAAAYEAAPYAAGLLCAAFAILRRPPCRR
jgi:hypothetical protein